MLGVSILYVDCSYFIYILNCDENCLIKNQFYSYSLVKKYMK